MFEAAPPSRRPSWYTATTVSPQAALSGSTAVSCWLSAFAYGSTEMRRDTTSQLAFTLSPASAATMSLPAPQSTESVPPKAAWTRSLPAPVTMRSGLGVPTIVSPAPVPWIVAAAALDAKSRKSRRRTPRRIGAAQPTLGTSPLSGSPPQRALAEHPVAGAADAALELVGDPRPLHDDVRAH